MDLSIAAHPYGGEVMSEGKRNPPQPLEARLPPSTRHRDGLPRCQRWAVRDREFWQCAKAARQGLSVCGVHGGGYEKREKAGERKNPATAAMTTGAYTKPETIGTFLQAQPRLRERFLRYLDDDDLLDFRPVLARCRAMLDELMEQIESPDHPNWRSELHRLIEAGHTIMRTGERLASIETKLGPITNAELESVLRVIVVTLDQFVPADKADEARAFLRAAIARAEVGRAASQQGV